ncbi:hypothetical protein VNO77_11513 [Canavalia gladiata]|uniref:Uncharacterized protein n=1 Tax=Canavalia gladiata TaxID=3824 RepID=A0AAN9MC88_CANGL
MHIVRVLYLFSILSPVFIYIYRVYIYILTLTDYTNKFKKSSFLLEGVKNMLGGKRIQSWIASLVQYRLGSALCLARCFADHHLRLRIVQRTLLQQVLNLSFYLHSSDQIDRCSGACSNPFVTSSTSTREKFEEAQRKVEDFLKLYALVVAKCLEHNLWALQRLIPPSQKWNTRVEKGKCYFMVGISFPELGPLMGYSGLYWVGL